MLIAAGRLRHRQGNHPSSFAMLTTQPGPDVEPIHNRQVVVFRPQDWSVGIYLTKSEGELLRSLPAESLGAANTERDQLREVMRSAPGEPLTICAPTATGCVGSYDRAVMRS